MPPPPPLSENNVPPTTSPGSASPTIIITFCLISSKGFDDATHTHIIALHRAALAQGAWCNRERHAVRYITYMLDASIPHLTPMPYGLAQFIAHLHLSRQRIRRGMHMGP